MIYILFHNTAMVFKGVTELNIATNAELQDFRTFNHKLSFSC